MAAEGEVGVDVDAERSALGQLRTLEWEGFEGDLTLTITASGPQATREPSEAGCPDAVPVISSVLTATLTGDGVFEAQLEGVGTYLPSSPTISLDGAANSISGGLERLVTEAGFDPAEVNEYMLDFSGDLSGGDLALVLDLGDGGEQTARSGMWTPR